MMWLPLKATWLLQFDQQGHGESSSHLSPLGEKPGERMINREDSPKFPLVKPLLVPPSLCHWVTGTKGESKAEHWETIYTALSSGTALPLGRAKRLPQEAAASRWQQCRQYREASLIPSKLPGYLSVFVWVMRCFDSSVNRFDADMAHIFGGSCGPIIYFIKTE